MNNEKTVEIMNNLDIDYQNLLSDILHNGIRKIDRTGTGTISVFGRQIRHKMSSGFPLLTTKHMAWKSIVTELIWFLSGSTNIKYLVENKCLIWIGDAYKKYCSHNEHISKAQFIQNILLDDNFSNEHGELGPIYGKQWKNWNGIDQISTVIDTLKKDPDNRRLLVSSWNVSELNEMVVPPCHYSFQLYTRDIVSDSKQHDSPTKAISLLWNQRSVDVPLGLPFNIASYGLLLSMIAKEVNMLPDELIGNFGDTHIYLNQIEGVNEQLSRSSFDLPTLQLESGINSTHSDIKLLNYTSHPKIYFPLSN